MVQTHHVQAIRNHKRRTNWQVRPNGTMCLLVASWIARMQITSCFVNP